MNCDSFCKCEWQEKIAGHGYANANASRPEVFMGSNFSANFFGQFFPQAFFCRRCFATNPILLPPQGASARLVGTPTNQQANP